MKRKYREKKLVVPRKQNKNIPEDKERKKVYPKNEKKNHYQQA